MDGEAHSTRPTAGALFALLYRPGPHWVHGEPLDRQPLAAHLAYMEELSWAGRIALAGPFLDAAAGLAVLRAADAEAAAAVLANDPAVRHGVLGDVAEAQRAANVETVRRIFAASGT
jgi:uncharacterized protein YciI